MPFTLSKRSPLGRIKFPLYKKTQSSFWSVFIILSDRETKSQATVVSIWSDTNQNFVGW